MARVASIARRADLRSRIEVVIDSDGHADEEETAPCVTDAFASRRCSFQVGCVHSAPSDRNEVVIHCRVGARARSRAACNNENALCSLFAAASVGLRSSVPVDSPASLSSCKSPVRYCACICHTRASVPIVIKQKMSGHPIRNRKREGANRLMIAPDISCSVACFLLTAHDGPLISAFVDIRPPDVSVSAEPRRLPEHSLASSCTYRAANAVRGGVPPI